MDALGRYFTRAGILSLRKEDLTFSAKVNTALSFLSESSALLQNF